MPADDDLAYRDPLTGAHNRRYLSDLFETQWRSLLQQHGTVSLIMIDLDGFKAVNDNHGHLVGDDVLRATVDLLRTHFRANDSVIRYGGDEFVILLPGVSAEDARGIAIRARAEGEANPNTAARGRRAIAFSFGVAASPADGESGDLVLEAADRRLYIEKRHRGRKFSPLLERLPVALALLALALVAWYGLSGWRENRTVLPVQAPSPVTLTAGTPDTAEVELRAQIHELQSRLQELTEVLAAERSRERRGEYQGRITELDGSIRTLALQLERRPTPQPSPVRTSTPAVAPSPVVSGDSAPAAPNLTPSPSLVPEVAVAMMVETPIEILVPPRLLMFANPAYPPVARSLRKDATVVLRLQVGANGRVKSADTLGREMGYGFEGAAKSAALRAIYEPARRGETAVEMETILTVRFELER